VSLDFPYMRRSVDAALRLAMRDQRAWEEFDLTTDGFFRSFSAIFLVVPLMILMDMFGEQLSADRHAKAGEVIAAHAYGLGDAVFSTLTLVVQWLIFPVTTLFVLRFVGLAYRYSALIIAHNWATVVVALANLPAFLLYAAGLVSAQQTLDLYFIVLGLTLYYRFYITQTALDAGWSIAAGITLLDFLLQNYFAIAVTAMAGLWLPAS
jgi:hypothetical protein